MSGNGHVKKKNFNVIRMEEVDCSSNLRVAIDRDYK
jgi:hypothetical protein